MFYCQTKQNDNRLIYFLLKIFHAPQLRILHLRPKLKSGNRRYPYPVFWNTKIFFQKFPSLSSSYIRDAQLGIFKTTLEISLRVLKYFSTREVSYLQAAM